MIPQHHPEPEQPLRFRGAQEKISAQQRIDDRCVIVLEHLRAAAVVVVEVFNDERIVQVDDCRDRAGVRKKFVRDVTLHDRDVGVVALLQQRFRCHRRRK